LTGRGRLGWIGLAYRASAGGFEANPLDDSLYEGSVGIAIFLAALHRMTGEAKFRDTALAAIGDLRDLIRSVPDWAKGSVVSKSGIGAGGGIGGQIYSFVRIAELLGEPTLIKDAERLSAWITDEAIAGDGEHDVLGGSAGAIAGLLALHAYTRKDAVLERAYASGLHLIAKHADPATKAAGTDSFGHGGFGVAAQLARLGLRTGRGEFAAAARQMFACERISSEAPSKGAHKTRSMCCQVGWCNGAAGIGLAFLDAIPLDDGSGAAMSTIEAAALSVSERSTNGLDQVCCGAFAGVEFLTCAGRSLNRPKWQDSAWGIAAAVVGRAGRTGGFRLLPGVPHDYAGPSFFQGIAGIGYGLLRLADPDALPSILALE
jgi:lantibiotic modifying enzyme